LVFEALEPAARAPDRLPAGKCKRASGRARRLSSRRRRTTTGGGIETGQMTPGVKLSCVLSDLMGVTGRGIIEAMIAGELSPDKLSWKVRGSLRKKEKAVKESLKGCFDEFHRDVLKRFYRQYTFLSSEMEESLMPIIAPVGRL
jgi:hypothetical protein